MNIKNLLPNTLKHICSFFFIFPKKWLQGEPRSSNLENKVLYKDLFVLANLLTQQKKMNYSRSLCLCLLISFCFTWLRPEGWPLICCHTELFYMTSHNLISCLWGLLGTLGQASGRDKDIPLSLFFCPVKSLVIMRV